ncbi:MAG: DUF4465 domain-containing protein [Bacteroidaceae bacterium]|nr:DUF4465 domain-containing protein [Bacteroidaceae bacterium]
MNQIKMLAVLLCAGWALMACDEETEDLAKVVTFEGDYWNHLVDEPQYGGPLLYSGNPYTWTDAPTQLTSSLTDAYGDMMYWGGGIAISNYVNPSDTVDYRCQLSVPVGNGSTNFAVANDCCSMSFADGNAYVLRTVDVCPTTYCINNMKQNLADGYFFKVILTADNGNRKEIALATDNEMQTTWKRVDLSELGAVKQLTITFDGSDCGDWGLNTPKYVAFDNIVVVTPSSTANN